jgi:hypothetical protein
MTVLDEILFMIGCQRDGKLHAYWCLPEKEICDGLVPLETDEDCASMLNVIKTEKCVVLFIDHSNFLKHLRYDAIIRNKSLTMPSMTSPEAPMAEPAKSREGEASSSGVVVSHQRQTEEGDHEFEDFEREKMQSEEEDDGSDSDYELYDSDCNAVSGDDDLFVDDIDKDVNDNNEKEVAVEMEDEAALEDQDLHLLNEERQVLKKKFSTFDPIIDMENPVFKVGLVFSSIEEARKALLAYTVRARKKIRKITNNRSRLEAVCNEGCPWMIKIAKDTRWDGGFAVTAYAGKHTCESVWELREFTANFLKEKFMTEFRDNQKLGLASFAAKVTREYNMCPDRWKLSRARKAALTEIHGDEEEQFSQLLDYGQELRRSNPGSKFFVTTNSVGDPGSADHKQHLATVYWSYDACKRGFLAGCRPLIYIDGCHIKTRFKGVLLTAVGIDPNDCIFPIAFGLAEVECTSSWEWFLTNLKEDLNISNTSPWTIMSDKQKVFTCYL